LSFQDVPGVTLKILVAGFAVGRLKMVGLATTIFVGIFAWGDQFLGWSSHNNDEVQLGLFISFILGIVAGYKTKG
jgi:hypothetical protein